MQTEKYHYRDSFFNLVELSLLARIYEEYCTPSSGTGVINKGSLAQTLLKMKATETQGQLRVAIHGEDIVGFFWKFDDEVVAQWAHPDHRNSAVMQNLQGH